MTQVVVPMQVNIHEAKTHLSKLIRYALEGEEVVIAKGNRALVRLEVLPGARPESWPSSVCRMKLSARSTRP